MRKSEFRAEGLGYAIDYPESETSFHVDRLRVSSGDMKGHLMVRTRLAGARTYANGILHYSQENLSSSTSRKSLGNLLREKVPSDPPIDWFGMYDEFCTMVMLADREGRGADLVGAMPDSPFAGQLVEPLVLRGVHSILFGDGGLGKSILAVGVAVSLYTGKEIIPGLKPMGTGNTLYLNWETSREDIDQRIKAVCAGAGIKPVELNHLSGGGRPLAQRVDSISRDIDKADAALLVIDSNGKAIGTSGEGPIEDAANRFASALDELGRTALCIDHVSKAGASAQGGAGKPYGSTMKSNWARATWEMSQSSRPDNGDTHLVLHHRKHNITAEHAPIGLLMRWDRGAVAWESEDVTSDALAYGSTVKDRIAAVLSEHPYRVKEIADRVGTTDATVRAELHRYPERFAKVDTGDWGLVDSAT